MLSLCSVGIMDQRKMYDWAFLNVLGAMKLELICEAK